MDLGLTDKTALVLASSAGIGRGIAQALLDEGCTVIISSSDEAKLETTRGELSKRAEGRVHAHRMDLYSLADVSRGAEEIAARYQIDILVTNGPGPPPCAALEIEEEELLRALVSTVEAPIFLCKRFVPEMKTRGFGRVVMLASSTAKEPDEGMVLSNVTRAAVVSFAKTLAREVAPAGVTVNSILIGSVLSERSEGLMRAEAADAGLPYERYLEEAAETIPVGYISTPEEFAAATVFLSSRQASYINGVSLAVDGGYMRSI